MVYEGWLKLIRLGKYGIEKEDGERRNVKVKKGENIIEELNVTVNGCYEV
ncbi:flagellar export chaperone FliS [Bacillus pumilus]|nr:hypothetical protein [Bacillus pumilus]